MQRPRVASRADVYVCMYMCVCMCVYVYVCTAMRLYCCRVYLLYCPHGSGPHRTYQSLIDKYPLLGETRSGSPSSLTSS
jgi:hypothetical protein